MLRPYPAGETTDDVRAVRQTVAILNGMYPRGFRLWASSPLCDSISNVDLDGLRARVDSEMAAAVAARRQGNEGRARVCARRAAGAAVAAYLAATTGKNPPQNTIELLQWFTSQASVADALRSAAARLTIRVDTDHRLPHTEDPLIDARDVTDAILARLGEPSAALPRQEQDRQERD